MVIRGKDKMKKFDQTNVVYEFSSEDCAAHYTSGTKLALRKQISEHSRNKKEELVVNIHQNMYNHEFDFKSVKIKD